VSLQIEKKWLGDEAVDGSKIKILDGQALVAEGQSGDVDLIKLNESGDAVVPQGIVASEDFVTSEISSEATLRIAGDAATLASAESYTDAEVLEEKGLREAEDLTMFKKDGSRSMAGNVDMAFFKIGSLGNGMSMGDAVNKGQLDGLESNINGQISTLQSNLEAADVTLQSNIDAEATTRGNADSALSLRLDALEADEVTKAYVDAADLVLDGKITTEKGRIDAILLSAGANTDTFAEIVSLINSVDTENDSAFAGYVLSNDAAVAALQSEVDATQTGAGLGSNGSYSAPVGTNYLGSASSLKDADFKLDAQIKVVADELASEVSSLESADSALDGRLDVLEADPTTKLYVDTQISIEGFARLDGDTATLASANSYTDAEVLEEKTRAEGQEAMLGMRLTALEGQTLESDLKFEVGVNGVGVNSITLPVVANKIYKVCVGRLNVFKGVDYTVGTEMVMSGPVPMPKTKLTWIGELASNGSSPISSGDKIFISYLYNA
jgi:hypothetical protein